MNANRLPAGTEFARLEQLPDGATLGLVLGEAEWPVRAFLVRVGAEVHAYLNRCPHAGRQLNFLPDRFLSKDGELIQCIQHGALFEKATGECIAGPCVGDRLVRIPVEVADGVVRSAAELDLDALSRPPW
jgi:nitrite reductase/ring-hydroxylating ferredoxin subunit